MAKVPFTKLYAKEDLGKTSSFEWRDLEIEVKQYLPLIEKLNIIQNIAMTNVEGRDFLNPLEIYSAFDSLIVSNYTNISFTEKQRTTDVIKTYDVLKEIGLIDKIKSHIPKIELDEIYFYFENLLQNIMTYRSSALCLVKDIASKGEVNDESLIDFDKLKSEISDNPQLLDLVKFYQQEIQNSGTKQENDNVIKMNN